MRHRFQLKGDFVTRYSSTASIEGELYQLLRERLPLYRSRRGRLDVSKLANALGMSPEGVYLWLRHDEVSRSGRRRLLELSYSPENTIALAGNEPLRAEDLYRFC